MVRREDLDALLDTIEILSNPETIEQRYRRAKKISLLDDSGRSLRWTTSSMRHPEIPGMIRLPRAFRM